MTVPHMYSSRSNQRERYNEYQTGVSWFSKLFWVLVLWRKVASALEGLTSTGTCASHGHLGTWVLYLYIGGFYFSVLFTLSEGPTAEINNSYDITFCSEPSIEGYF